MDKAGDGERISFGKNKMTERIIIAGAGGQGIMLLGKVLAEAAMRENKYVTWLPAYGAEVRGGTAHCMVIISDEEIGSPYMEKADTLIIMNAPSLARFKNMIKNKGLLIINASLVKKDVESACSLKYPFTEIAARIGNIRIANMVAAGCYLAHKKILKIETIMRVIAEIAPPDKKDLIEINKKAVYEGMKLKDGKS
jgi:2-oxoglutarate ferredoxin oxidoreductase subunit gamma